MQKQVRRKFKTAQVRVTSIDAQFDADLSYVRNLAKEKEKVQYLLFATDIFSRDLWVKPLKDKKAKSVLEALKVSKGAKIRNLYNQVPHLTQDTNGKVTNSQKTPQTRIKWSALSQQVTTKHI